MAHHIQINEYDTASQQNEVILTSGDVNQGSHMEISTEVPQEKQSRIILSYDLTTLFLRLYQKEFRLTQHRDTNTKLILNASQ